LSVEKSKILPAAQTELLGVGDAVGETVGVTVGVGVAVGLGVVVGVGNGVAAGVAVGDGVGVTVGVGVGVTLGVGVTVGVGDGGVVVTVIAEDLASLVKPSFAKRRSSYVPTVVGKVIALVPELRAAVPGV